MVCHTTLQRSATASMRVNSKSDTFLRLFVSDSHALRVSGVIIVLLLMTYVSTPSHLCRSSPSTSCLLREKEELFGRQSNVCFRPRLTLIPCSHARQPRTVGVVFFLQGGVNVCGRHGVTCNICHVDDFHPSRCTTPSESNHVAGSAWEPEGHSMCTSDVWRDRDSMEHEPWRLALGTSGCDARRPLDSTTSHGDTFQLLWSPRCVFWLRSAFRVPKPWRLQ